MAYLTRTDPSRNIDRFYVVDIMPTLFGDWTVMREWGRSGSPGTLRLDTSSAPGRCRCRPTQQRQAQTAARLQCATIALSIKRRARKSCPRRQWVQRADAR